MIALRRGMAGSPLALWGGVALAPVALVFAVTGTWIAAAGCSVAALVLLWLAGVWVMPWGPDAYMRRLVNAFDAWSAGAKVAYATADRAAARLTPSAAPPRFAAEHARAVALEAEAHRERSASELPYPERQRAAVAALHALDELSGTLTASATDEAERAYAGDLVARISRRREAFATAMRNDARGGGDALARLQRTVAPHALAGEHADLVAAMRAELEARRALEEAVGALDPEGAAAAAAVWETRSAELDAAWRTLLRSSGAAERWPIAET